MPHWKFIHRCSGWLDICTRPRSQRSHFFLSWNTGSVEIFARVLDALPYSYPLCLTTISLFHIWHTSFIGVRVGCDICTRPRRFSLHFLIHIFNVSQRSHFFILHTLFIDVRVGWDIYTIPQRFPLPSSFQSVSQRSRFFISWYTLFIVICISL